MTLLPRFSSFAIALVLGTSIVAGCARGSDDVGSAASEQRTAMCEAVGGECRSSPNDPIFPANCLDDFGRAEVRGQCASLNQACCAKPASPDPMPACAAAGGDCLSSIVDETQPANCLSEFGRPEVRGACGAGTTCCERERRPPPMCEVVGGECKSSPNDDRFAANCEDDFGLATLTALCPGDNQRCCGTPRPRGPCELAGGECRTNPNDPAFPASCEDDFGTSTLRADCGAGKTCCAR